MGGFLGGLNRGPLSYRQDDEFPPGMGPDRPPGTPVPASTGAQYNPGPNNPIAPTATAARRTIGQVMAALSACNGNAACEEPLIAEFLDLKMNPAARERQTFAPGARVPETWQTNGRTWAIDRVYGAGGQFELDNLRALPNTQAGETVEDMIAAMQADRTLTTEAAKYNLFNRQTDRALAEIIHTTLLGTDGDRSELTRLAGLTLQAKQADLERAISQADSAGLDAEYSRRSMDTRLAMGRTQARNAVLQGIATEQQIAQEGELHPLRVRQLGLSNNQAELTAQRTQLEIALADGTIDAAINKAIADGDVAQINAIVAKFYAVPQAEANLAGTNISNRRGEGQLRSEGFASLRQERAAAAGIADPAVRARAFAGIDARAAELGIEPATLAVGADRLAEQLISGRTTSEVETEGLAAYNAFRKGQADRDQARMSVGQSLLNTYVTLASKATKPYAGAQLAKGFIAALRTQMNLLDKQQEQDIVETMAISPVARRLMTQAGYTPRERAQAAAAGLTADGAVPPETATPPTTQGTEQTVLRSLGLQGGLGATTRPEDSDEGVPGVEMRAASLGGPGERVGPDETPYSPAAPVVKPPPQYANTAPSNQTMSEMARPGSPARIALDAGTPLPPELLVALAGMKDEKEIAAFLEMFIPKETKDKLATADHPSVMTREEQEAYMKSSAGGSYSNAPTQRGPTLGQSATTYTINGQTYVLSGGGLVLAEPPNPGGPKYITDDPEKPRKRYPFEPWREYLGRYGSMASHSHPTRAR